MIKHFAADGTVKREWPDGLHTSGFEQDGKRFAIVAKSNAVETVELADGEQVGEAFVAAIASALAAEDVHPIESALAATPASVDVQQVKNVLDWSHRISGADPSVLPPVAIAPEPAGLYAKPFTPLAVDGEPIAKVHTSISYRISSPDATPMIETELGQIVQPAEFASLPSLPIEIKTVPGITTATFNALTPTGIVISIHDVIPGSTTEHHVPSPSEVVETAAHALSDAAAVLKEEEARNASNAGALNVEPQEAQATHSTEAQK